ncbi:cysteine-rich CWC family protein [Tellurirhabdus bombi]|uniref:cysteine-rich CWC family protein n=1 Tax=Tellurirhabdus bombi TaxID=2907205 RepID=UPI00387F40F5
MTKHAAESCSRCNQLFTCKVNSILKCDCLAINLTRQETEYIRELTTLDYDGECLCLQCLYELKAAYQQAAESANLLRK